MTESQDFTAQEFSPQRVSTSARRPMHIDLEAQPPTQTHDVDVSDAPIHSPTESVRQRRINRSNTVKSYRPERRGGQAWQPGAEPGIDTSAPVDPYSRLSIHEICQITTVDFSQTEVQQHELDNDTLGPFMAQPRPDWAVCRWINVNGLSWDVVKLLGNHYGLHRLAIEDLINPRNRTKADWYTDHTYSMFSCEISRVNRLTQWSGPSFAEIDPSTLQLRLRFRILRLGRRASREW